MCQIGLLLYVGHHNTMVISTGYVSPDFAPSVVGAKTPQKKHFPPLEFLQKKYYVKSWFKARTSFK